jgi:hypothetical protein
MEKAMMARLLRFALALMLAGGVALATDTADARPKKKKQYRVNPTNTTLPSSRSLDGRGPGYDHTCLYWSDAVRYCR